MSTNNYSDTRGGLPATTDRDDICPECGRRITVGKTGTEYGHDRGTNDPRRERCPRRPDSVDPRTKTWGDRDV